MPIFGGAYFHLTPGRFDHVPRDVRAWFCAWLSDRLPIAIFDFVYSIGLYVWLGLELYT